MHNVTLELSSMTNIGYYFRGRHTVKQISVINNAVEVWKFLTAVRYKYCVQLFFLALSIV
jgi:hypothetical protein